LQDGLTVLLNSVLLFLETIAGQPEALKRTRYVLAKRLLSIAMQETALTFSSGSLAIAERIVC